MRSCSARAIVLAIAIMMSMSACQLSLGMTTHVNADGSGTFTLSMGFDKELTTRLKQTPSDLATVDALFEGLQKQGWMVTRTETAGSLHESGTRAFVDAEGFGRALQELRSGQSGPKLRDIHVALNYSTSTSFFKNTARFTGDFDTSGFASLGKALLQRLQPAITFEVRAELPGAPAVLDHDGVVDGNAIVWRPEIGTVTKLSADGSSIRVVPVLLVILAGLLLVAGGAWFVLGRKKKPLHTRVIIPDGAEHEMRALVLDEPKQD